MGPMADPATLQHLLAQHGEILVPSLSTPQPEVSMFSVAPSIPPTHVSTENEKHPSPTLPPFDSLDLHGGAVVLDE